MRLAGRLAIVLADANAGTGTDAGTQRAESRGWPGTRRGDLLVPPGGLVGTSWWSRQNLVVGTVLCGSIDQYLVMVSKPHGRLVNTS